MKILDCEQGSPEWIEARLGLPTASNFDMVVTPKTGKPSAQQRRYLARLLAEWYLGVPLDSAETDFMQRGREMEPLSIPWYELDADVDTRKVGLCLTDDGKVGASPDRLVAIAGALGGVEIKCASAEVHMSYLINRAELVEAYWCQSQGQIWVCGLAWVDLVAYHPALPKVRLRVLPNPEFQAALSECLTKFVVMLDALKCRYAEQRAEYLEEQRAAMDQDDPFASMPADPVDIDGAFP